MGPGGGGMSRRSSRRDGGKFEGYVMIIGVPVELP